MLITILLMIIAFILGGVIVNHTNNKEFFKEYHQYFNQFSEDALNRKEVSRKEMAEALSTIRLAFDVNGDILFDGESLRKIAHDALLIEEGDQH